MRFRFLPLVPWIAALAAPCAAAQVQLAPLYTLASPVEQEQSLFGSPLVSVGDVDGDGVPDLAASAPDEDAALPGGDVVVDGGQVHLFSGATGASLRTFVSPEPEPDGFFGGHVLAAGDRDGDGVSDLYVSSSRLVLGGAGNVGRVYVLSGADGLELARLDTPNPTGGGEFGSFLARLGDLTGDGVGEIGVSAVGETAGALDLVRAGKLYVFDGATDALVLDIEAPDVEVEAGFGYTSDDAGDVDGDGVPDIVTGAPFRTGTDGASELVGRLYLISGADGSAIRTVASPTETQLGFFGRWVAGLGDVDGDGVPDVVSGGNGEPIQGDYRGRAHVISGADGQAVRTLASPDEQFIGFYGEVLTAVGDLDGDGVTDFAVSARAEDDDAIGPNVYIGRVYVHSGATGDVLATLKPPAPDPDGIQYFGYTVASLGDLTGDGLPEIGVGAWADNPGDSPAYAGRAYVFSGALSTSAPEAPAAGDAVVLRLAGPNPSGPSVRFAATVPGAGPVRVDVFDVLGRRVAVLHDGVLAAGLHPLALDGQDLAPGSYVARLSAAGVAASVRFTVAR